MNITEVGQIKKFLTMIKKINNLMKNVKGNSEYIIVKGMCITYPDDNDLGVTKLNISLPGGKKDNIDNLIPLINGKIDGIKLFKFLEVNKGLAIKEIILDKNKITFIAEEETFVSDIITSSEYNFSKYKEFIKTKKSKNPKEIFSEEINDDIKKEFLNSTFPSLKLSYMELRITPKQFIKITDKFENSVKLETYENDRKVLTLTTKNKDFLCEQQYLIILND